MWRHLILLLILFVTACTKPSEKGLATRQTLFHRLPAGETGIHFENTVTVQGEFDVFRYRNFYNGGGVAIGDINNDGLSDVYLTSNMGDNKLFLNQGNFKFEDITPTAGVAGTKVWSTGVSMVDINADGWLDIYVCNSGDIKGNRRENELFINNGNLTFTEQAEQYGLADRGFSTHAAFFDYDKDGDLDCYVLNNSFRPISTLGYKNLRNERDPDGGDKLFNNRDGHFYDVSEEAGIFGSVIGFGLGVTVGDVNQDGWSDIYISNDFYERDYLYINNRNGTFSDRLTDYMGHISMFSMGADLADLNNDAYPEIFSTDMLPENYYRLKTLTAFETYDVYQLRLKNDYYHQFMQNMLHMNNKDGTYSEIGQLAGVAATDWSWGALIMDFDNDSNKEIFVSNGIYKDVIDQDFIEYMGSSDVFHAAIDGKKVDFTDFHNRMPSTKLSNYMYVKAGEWQYKNIAQEWGLAEPSFSNGAAYGDLDNDGDLDLIVNNVNQEVFVYTNQSREHNKNNSVTITFKGETPNSFGLGATVKVFVGSEILYYENNPIRGFQSSMDYRMLIGLGERDRLDSIYITWPDERREVLRNVEANQKIEAVQSNALPFTERIEISKTLLKEVGQATTIRHVENTYNDFDRDRLQYHMLSTQGPALAVADINQDGRDDFYIGGSVGHPGKIYIQKMSGSFEPLNLIALEQDSLADDTAAVFLDADGDHDLDLYVVSGGSENLGQSASLLDRFYENKGMKGGQPVFEIVKDKIPSMYQSGSCVREADVDNDGDLDLFVGTRVIPSYYGVPCDQFILLNDGKGNFTDATPQVAPQLRSFGMVTDAMWFDYDGNAFPDLIVAGEWMPITIFKNDGRQLSKVGVAGLEKSHGWWNVIQQADFNGDGAMDFFVGNVGLNTKFKPSSDSPLTLFVNDFDQNGSVEPIVTSVVEGHEYPMAMRQDIIKQMSSLKKKFVYYKEFAQKSTSDIFDKTLMDKAYQGKFYEARSIVLINDKKGGYSSIPLPVQAQVSPVFAVVIDDFNSDGKQDIFLGGNLYAVKPEVCRYDASHGLVLLGDGAGNFNPISSLQSGIQLSGEVRHIERLKTGNGSYTYLVVRNNDSVKIYSKQ